MKIKLTYIISDIDKSLGLEWASSYIDKDKFHLNFILLNEGNSYMEEFLKQHKIHVYRIEIKNQFDFIKAFGRLAYLLLSLKPDIVHCHLRKAELIGIPISYLLRIKKRIYTRHNATYNHLFHPKGVWVDKFISRLSTEIVAVSGNVKKILIEWENVQPSKIKLIPHGFDLSVFKEVQRSQIEEIKKKYDISNNHIIIGVIARYTWWKGYAYSIPAIGMLMKENPTVFLVIANANGNDKFKIKKLIKEHIPKDRVREIVFEHNLPALYKTFDYYVHVPFDATVEAFGQTYVEALAAEVPSVFTLSGIALDFIQDRKNALVVNYKSKEEIYRALKELIENPTLSKKLAAKGFNDVKRRFSVETMIDELEKLYVTKQSGQKNSDTLQLT